MSVLHNFVENRRGRQKVTIEPLQGLPQTICVYALESIFKSNIFVVGFPSFQTGIPGASARTVQGPTQQSIICVRIHGSDVAIVVRQWIGVNFT